MPPDANALKNQPGQSNLNSAITNPNVNLTRTILLLAWPVMAAMLVQIGMTIANIFWVGKLGTDAVAAVISSLFVYWIIWSILAIITTGVTALVSRFIGANHFDLAEQATRQSLLLAFVSASVFVALGEIFARQIFVLMANAPQVSELGASYLRILFCALPFLFFNETLGAACRASGNTRTPMQVSLTELSINIILDPLLILGIGPVPKLGVSGAALASAIALTAGFLLYLHFLNKKKLPFTLMFIPIVRIDWNLWKQIVIIGLPISISGITFTAIYLFIDRLTAEFGTSALAALGFGNRLESISYFVCAAFSVAVATIVGQNLGARNPERAENSAWRAIFIVSVYTGIIGILFLAIPQHLIGLFSKDPAVHKAGIGYLRILGLSQVFMALEIVLEGAFSGAGETLPPMLVAIPGALLRPPLAYFIAYTLAVGVNGVWWALAITSILKGLAILIWFRAGKWKKRQIDYLELNPEITQISAAR